MNIRAQNENIERKILSEYACLSENSKGRKEEEKPCDIRTCFQRDKDRILHCNAFKRLKHKTQVFLSPKRDHYRTRLVHSLEVSQISRTVARGIRLNEDLVEAIALGHDLGHAPFGHAGESALNEICPHRFNHAENSVRVVEFLERYGKGLNLSEEVIDGIRWHSHGGQKASTLEGRVVQICDKVAYINHDIEDALRAGIVKEQDLPKHCVEVLGDTKTKRITTIVKSLIENSSDNIFMAQDILDAHMKLREYMFLSVYADTVAQKEQSKAEEIVKIMYRHYLGNITKMPEFYQEIAKKVDKDRAVCDYISGMSDNYIIEAYKDTFIPKAWSI